MNVACPCCRASNTGTQCRRCKADLSLLAAWKAQAQRDAVRALLAGDYAKALTLHAAAK